MSKFYDDEEYYGGSFEKFSHRKTKEHKKGHQSRSSGSEKKTWEKIIMKQYAEDTETISGLNNTLGPDWIPSFKAEPVAQKNEHQFSNNTHEIKGVKIDFDGVADIQKIDNVKDGRKTYGIKFFFKGKKGLFRIIWFNTDLTKRETVYNTEYSFWLNINK